MTALAVRLACAVVRAWVGLYTLGLPPAARTARIDLVRADLHDEVADPSTTGIATLLSLLGRCAGGAPSDLSWRLFDVPPGVADLGKGRHVVRNRSLGAGYYLMCAAAWLAMSAAFLVGVGHSLAWAGGLLGLVALTGWLLEARQSPDAAGPSAWPLLMAVAVGSIAGGAVFPAAHLGLLLTIPATLGFGAAAFLAMAHRSDRRGVPNQPATLPAPLLAQREARGDAIAIERPQGAGVSRRALLRGGFGIGLASLVAAMGGVMVDFLWRRNVSGFGSVVTAGAVTDFPPGSKTIVREGKFWLVSLTEDQGGPGLLALWQKCPHLGCVVPWLDSFTWFDPDKGHETQGWFRCPCHQSTYNSAGVRVYGPAPRSMDRMRLQVTPQGIIEVDTGDISKGTDDNASYAVRAP